MIGYGPLVLLAAVVTAGRVADGLSIGPLGPMCGPMDPGAPNGHPATPQTTPPPYTLTANATCYTVGQILKFTLSRKTAADFFEGFMFEAREDPDDPTAAYGTFSRDPGQHLRIIDCFDQKANGLGSTESGRKSEMGFYWSPPNPAKGEELTMTGSVVQTLSVFWTRKVNLVVPMCPGSPTYVPTLPTVPPVTPKKTTTTTKKPKQHIDCRKKKNKKKKQCKKRH